MSTRVHRVAVVASASRRFVAVQVQGVPYPKYPQSVGVMRTATVTAITTQFNKGRTNL